MKNFAEAFMKSARHDIVQDRIDGRVDVEHHSAEVQEKVIGFYTNDFTNIII